MKYCMKVVSIVLVFAFSFSLMVWSAGQAESEESVEITYWDLFEPSPNEEQPRAYALWEAFNLFEEKYPNIKVKAEAVPWGVIERKLIPMAASGETPDVVNVIRGLLALHVDAGTIAPIDKYVASWDSSDWMGGWEPMTIKGKIWGLPAEYRAQVMFEYRADFLKEAGLTVPTTWQDLAGAAKKLTTKTRRGFSIGASLKDTGLNLNELLMTLVWDAGGEIFDEDFNLLYDNEAGLEAFQMLYDLMHKYHAIDKTVLDEDYSTIHQAFVAGTLAMGTISSVRVGTIRKQGNLGENFQIAPLPSYKDGGLHGVGKPSPTLLDGWNHCLGKYAKHPEEAMLLMKWMSEPIVKIKYAKAGIVPPRYSVFKDPFFDQDTLQVRDLLTLKKYIGDYGKFVINPPWNTDYWKLVATEIQRMWLDQQTPQETLATIVKKYKADIMK